MLGLNLTTHNRRICGSLTPPLNFARRNFTYPQDAEIGLRGCVRKHKEVVIWQT